MSERIDVDAFNATPFTNAQANELRLRILAMQPGDVLISNGVESTCTGNTPTGGPTFTHHAVTMHEDRESDAEWDRQMAAELDRLRPGRDVGGNA